MKNASTMLLRAAVLGMGLVALVVCSAVLPAIHREWPLQFPEVSYLRYPVILVLAAAAASFFVALFQTLKLLTYIDTNRAFSQLALKSLRVITYCASIVSGVFVAGMPLVYYIAESDDAPGLIILGMLFVGAPLVVALFAAVLEKLLRSAIAIKKENDLTV